MNLIAFDWETTSNKPETTRGVQFAAYHAGTREAIFNTLCDPEVDIHHEAAEVHGITTEMVQGKPKDYEVAKDFANYLDGLEGPIILATHNGTTFDIPITERLSGCKLPYWHIDTMILATRLWPLAPSHRLSANEKEAKKEGAIGLTQWLGLGSGEGAHDALEDILMVVDIIEYIQRSKDTELTSLEDLAAWCHQPYVHDICHFGKNRGKPYGRGSGKVPFFYVKWCCENWKDATLDIQATFLHHYGLSFRFPGAMK